MMVKQGKWSRIQALCTKTSRHKAQRSWPHRTINSSRTTLRTKSSTPDRQRSAVMACTTLTHSHSKISQALPRREKSSRRDPEFRAQPNLEDRWSKINKTKWWSKSKSSNFKSSRLEAILSHWKALLIIL